MNNFLSMRADDVFGFCCSRSWDARAWRFWHEYQSATAMPRANILLGGCKNKIEAAEAAKHLLSDAVRDDYCAKQSWSKQDTDLFLGKLFGKYR